MPQLSTHDKAVLNSVLNPNLPVSQIYEEELGLELKDIEDSTPDVMKSKELELTAIRKAEQKEFEEAISIFNNAIKITPSKASLYNNRGQVNQLCGKYEEAFGDLSKAIELGKKNQQLTMCQALCQRGLLYRKEGKDDLARDDFNIAAKMGSYFAKNQLIELNPYAALCNQMLKQAFESLK